MGDPNKKRIVFIMRKKRKYRRPGLNTDCCAIGDYHDGLLTIHRFNVTNDPEIRNAWKLNIRHRALGTSIYTLRSYRQLIYTKNVLQFYLTKSFSHFCCHLLKLSNICCSRRWGEYFLLLAKVYFWKSHIL